LHQEECFSMEIAAKFFKWVVVDSARNSTIDSIAWLVYNNSGHSIAPGFQKLCYAMYREWVTFSIDYLSFTFFCLTTQDILLAPVVPWNEFRHSNNQFYRVFRVITITVLTTIEYASRCWIFWVLFALPLVPVIDLAVSQLTSSAI